jgi:hypothetical protein
LRLRSPLDTPLPLPMNVLLMRWDTKPDKRIRRTFLHPATTRTTSFYAADRALWSTASAVRQYRARAGYPVRRSLKGGHVDGTGCFCLLVVLMLAGGGIFYLINKKDSHPLAGQSRTRASGPDAAQTMSDSLLTREMEDALRRLEPFRLDSEWFSDFFNSIIAQAGVDPHDDGNHMELILFYNKILGDMATSMMEGTGDHQALIRFRNHPEVGYPHVAARLLIEWNGECREIIAAKLRKFFPISVASGKKFGRIRIFPSPCCGEPRMWESAVSRCSGCSNVIPES